MTPRRWFIFPLNPAVFPNLEYARLRRSFEYFVEYYASAEFVTSESHYAKVLERDQRSGTNRAQSALAVAIAQFVEGTQDFCCERLAEIDRDLRKRHAYTLSFLREVFTNRS